MEIIRSMVSNVISRICVVISLVLVIGVGAVRSNASAQDLPKVTIGHSSRSIEAINLYMAEQHGYLTKAKPTRNLECRKSSRSSR